MNDVFSNITLHRQKKVYFVIVLNLHVPKSIVINYNLVSVHRLMYRHYLLLITKFTVKMYRQT